MALEILDSCIACWACPTVCPNAAIEAADALFRIDPALCSECAEAAPTPQCAAICPVEGAIVDALGIALNPPGSLGQADSLAAPAHRPG